jgi:hypothetical protein
MSDPYMKKSVRSNSTGSPIAEAMPFALAAQTLSAMLLASLQLG